MNNKWFILRDCGTINGDKFSFFTSTNHSYVKYDLLNMRFKISCCLQWFVYSWRRRDGENITYMYAQPEIDVALEELFAIPLFQTIKEEETFKRAKMIEQMINGNVDIKQAMIERYAKILGSKIYVNNEVSINIFNERFCDHSDIGTKRLFGDDNDDFSEMGDIKRCVIKSY